MKFELINHAAVVIEVADVKLLCDPWFFGHCFQGGWGLKVQNSAALERARRCTHLWISHFHGDHLHFPTLKSLCQAKPDLVALGNCSHNFQLDDVLRGVGFDEVVPLPERTPTPLGSDVRVTRFPSTGIDNMLLVEAQGRRILNYNDCNLPLRARRALARKMGPIDVLLTNYNHAGKFLHHPLPPAESIKEEMRRNFFEKVDAFEPARVLPFASAHYYRAPENREHNDSLMEVSELGDDPRIVPLEIGDTVEIDSEGAVRLLRRREDITVNPIEVRQQSETHTLAEIEQASRAYAAKVSRGFLHLLWLPPLRIRITDLDRTVRLDVRKGIAPVRDAEGPVHIAATSESLYRWLSAPYGTDTFWIGGHFEIVRQTRRLGWHLLSSLLVENGLDPVSLAKALVTPAGRRFLHNRREEITAIVIGSRLGIGKASR